MSANPIETGPWRPWRWPQTPAEAIGLARAGVLVAGLILAGYLLQLLATALGGHPNGGWGDAAPIIVAALLLWRIWARQALWACGLASLWFVAETLARLVADPAPAAARGAGIIMYAALSVAALTALAAALVLRRLDDAAEDGAPE